MVILIAHYCVFFDDLSYYFFLRLQSMGYKDIYQKRICWLRKLHRIGTELRVLAIHLQLHVFYDNWGCNYFRTRFYTSFITQTEIKDELILSHDHIDPMGNE